MQKLEKEIKKLSKLKMPKATEKEKLNLLKQVLGEIKTCLVPSNLSRTGKIGH